MLNSIKIENKDGTHIALGQSAMNFASASNGNVVAAAIGLSVAGGFLCLEMKSSR